MDHNNLVGTLGPPISSLTSLITINLSHNYLSGTFGNTLNSLNSLKKFDCSYNLFSGTVPLLFNSSNLTDLNFQNNDFTQLPTNILPLTALKTLALSVNPHLSGTIPSIINTFTSLENLNLYATQLNGTIPKINSLSQLVILYSIPYQFNDAFLPSSFALPSLTYLSIQHLKLNTISTIGPFPALQTL
uniref:Leucine-rich repeat-containing N-terminal plant-type domain-containing protein n=1 Tax=Arcella intermedia TaxID=1963864 RepID=A0A6B2LIK0_9EUKA